MQPFIKKDPDIQFMVDGKPYLVLGGEVHNSSSSCLNYMEPIWGKLKDLGLNTVITPISWELTEPQEGCFDFAVLEGLIERARKYGFRLILLWFATWKNTLSHYVPEWVKTDMKRFPRAQAADGKILPTISSLCDECRRLDGRALARVMARIQEIDTDHTVIAVQVENETGLLYSARDYRPEATALFEGSLPADLADYLLKNKDTLTPELAAHIDFSSLHGNWSDAFGILAEEAFMAYYTASYVGGVAADGKAAYELPMFANAWPAQCRNEPGGLHPSGGPTAQMHDIWRCAAPALDALAADLYLENFEEECAAYSRLPGNPLIIPEGRPDKWVMAHAFYSVAEHGAICFSPFGIEDVGQMKVVPPGTVVQNIFSTFSSCDTRDLIRDTYRVLDNISGLICQYRGSGKMHGVLQNRLMNQVLEFTHYYLHISFANYIDRIQFPSGGLIIELSENDFLLAGAGFSVQFVPKPKRPVHFEFLSIEEGSFQDGEWVRGRRLNGDELHPCMPDMPGLRRIRLFSY